ncbi:MAG: hypothetical protein KDB21_18390, partial [Acidimicrobiales bacterium]|nr:hypothetical protein [Acidimicrobiales bacterium]
MPYHCRVANRYWFSPADAGRTIERLGDLWRQVVSGLTPEVAAAAGVEAVGAAIVHGLAHEAQVEAPVLGPDLAIDVALDQLGATVS